jgi:hypothetical protein
MTGNAEVSIDTVVTKVYSDRGEGFLRRIVAAGSMSLVSESKISCEGRA